MKRAFPTADTSISALLEISSIFTVWELHNVTVAFLSSMRAARGFPTIVLEPKITTLFPKIFILYASRSFIIPSGVAGAIAEGFF